MTENHFDNYINNSNSIFITDEITGESAVKFQMQFYAILKKFDDTFVPEKDRLITLYITDCPGGSVSAGLAIYDTINCANTQIKIICSGMVASMGVILTLAGDKGLRLAYPNTEFLMHQPIAHGISGQTTDILIHSKHIEKIRNRIFGIIAERTCQPVEKISSDGERDFILDAEEAVRYGLIDTIYRPQH